MHAHKQHGYKTLVKHFAADSACPTVAVSFIVVPGSVLTCEPRLFVLRDFELVFLRLKMSR